MTSRQSPGLATWALRHFGCSPNNEAILGDLVERHQKGKSGIWYCRQVIIALVTGCVRETRENKWPMLRAIAAGWLLRSASIPLSHEPFLTKVLAWFGFNPAGALVGITFLAILIFGAIAIGWIVSWASGEHRKPAVIGYVASTLLYDAIDFGVQRYLFLSHNKIELTFYLSKVVIPMFLLSCVFFTVGTMLVLFGGGLLPLPAKKDS